MWNPMQADEALGLEREDGLLRGALVKYRKGAPVIQKLFTTHIESAKETTQAISDLPLSKTLLDRVMIVTGVSSEETIIRPLEIKLTKQSDVDKVLPFQAEPLLPYPIDQAYLDRWVLSKTEDSTQLSMLAVRKELLQNHLKWYEETFNIDPERVSTVSSALAVFANWFASAKGLTLILHLGNENGLFLLVEEGKVLAAQALPLAVTTLWSSSKPIEGEASSSVNQNIETLRQVLVRTLFAFTKQVKGRDIPNLIFTGAGVATCSILPTISKWLNKEPKELPAGQAHDSQELCTYAIPIGLACGVFPDSRNSDSIQLRQGEDLYTQPFKRLKKPLMAFTAASMLCAAAWFCLNTIALNTRENHLQAQYGTLLAQMDRTHEEVESHFSGKTGPAKLANCLSLQSLPPLAINRRLAFLEKENSHVPDTFPLQPNIFRVSDLLAWLSTHEMSTEVDPVTGEKTPFFQINSLSYQMVKRPDKNKPTEHYQVKVDLELQSSDSQGPRELYDALLQPNEVVDASNPVTWAAGQGKYRINFYLKDHTVYP